MYELSRFIRGVARRGISGRVWRSDRWVVALHCSVYALIQYITLIFHVLILPDSDRPIKGQ